MFEFHRLAYYDSAVIKSWRKAASREVWEGERPNRFRGVDLDGALDILNRRRPITADTAGAAV